MGEEIAKTRFEPEDFARFSGRLRDETELARGLFEGGRFAEEGFEIGFEVEAWLLDHAFFPAPINEALLAAVADPMVVPELSRFNVEFNATPRPLTGRPFADAAAEISAVWQRCNEAAHALDANVVLIGTLPTIRDADLSLANMSALKRYDALNTEVLRRRGGRPIRVAISGREELVSEHGDVMLEAATTSFQVHLRTPARLAGRYYNASLMASGPVLAASANAPFLFGRSLWDETRIPLFEQAVELAGDRPGAKRVGFGSGYIRHSLVEWLDENLAGYQPLLPLIFDDPAAELRHLRLHNGTIWRWNRPLIGFDADGTPHLRIEHRPLPAGPTVLDMMANAALYVGLAHAVVTEEVDRDGGLDFATAQENFYAAARSGLDARLTWPGAGTVDAATLLARVIIPAARRGLEAFGVAAADADLLDIVAARVANRQTGAEWQRRLLAASGSDFFRLMAAYCEGQRSGMPVHQWAV